MDRRGEEQVLMKWRADKGESITVFPAEDPVKPLVNRDMVQEVSRVELSVGRSGSRRDILRFVKYQVAREVARRLSPFLDPSGKRKLPDIISQHIEVEQTKDGSFHAVVRIPETMYRRNKALRMLIDTLKSGSTAESYGMRVFFLPEAEYRRYENLGRHTVEKQLKRYNLLFPERMASAVEFMRKKGVPEKRLSLALKRIVKHLLELQHHPDPVIAELSKLSHRIITTEVSQLRKGEGSLERDRDL